MFCTYFACDVELTEERKAHIRTYHPDAYTLLERFPDVLLNTDVIHRDYRPNSFLFGNGILMFLGENTSSLSSFETGNELGS